MNVYDVEIVQDSWMTLNVITSYSIHYTKLYELTYDAKYGGLTRTAATTNEWFQGASQTGTYAATAQATAVAPTLANISKWATISRRHLPTGLDGMRRPKNPLFMFCGETIYQDIQAQLEGRSELKDTSVMKAKS